MQIEFLMEVGEETIPCNYQYAVSSALYKTLIEYNPALGNRLHDGESRNRLKLFVFSCLNSDPHPKIVPGKDGRTSLLFGRRCWMRFASVVPEIVFNMSEALLNTGALLIHGVRFKVKKVEMVKPPQFRPSMIYRPFGQNGMIVCRYNGKTQFPDNSVPGLPDCDVLLAENLRHKLLRFYEVRPDILSNYLSVSNLTLDSIRDLEIKVEFLPLKPDLPFRTGLFEIKNTRQRAFRAPFRLTAPEVVHRIAWLCGAGSLNSQGFGFLTTGKQEEEQ